MQTCLKILPAVFLIFFSIFLFMPVAVHANQSEILTNGAVWNSAIATDSAGNVALIGSTTGFGDGQSLAVLMKYDPSGKLTCFRTFGGSSPLDTFGYGVAFDSSNNMYVTGTTQTFGGEDFDVFLQRYDSSCNLLSIGTGNEPIQWGGAGNDVPRGITVDSLDNVYITGYTYSFGAGQAQVFLLKYAGDGELQYSQTWGGVQNSFGTGIAVDLAGNVYVTGYSYNYGDRNIPNAFLLKFDPLGNLLFQQNWGGGEGDYATGIAVDGAGNIYVTGYTYSYGGTPGVANIFLLKYDPSGNLLSQKIWGSARNSFGSGVSVDLAGDVYVTGYTYGSSTSGMPNVILLKYDQFGNLVMQNTWGGNKGDYAYAVGIDTAGNVYVTGYTYSFGRLNSEGRVNIFLLKYNQLGNLMFQHLYGGGTPVP
jgi:hypothetical protein